MDESQRGTVTEIRNYDQDVCVSLGESEELEESNVADTEADLIKNNETNNETSSHDYKELSNCGEVMKHGETVESDNEMTEEELDVKEEPETINLFQTDPDHYTEDVKVSIVDDVIALFPFVCGVCFEKFNSLATYYMHISLHENVSVFLHSCELSVDGIDKDNVLFSCGICEIKFPTLCSLYEHLLRVERLTDFVYKDRERTAYAYIDPTKHSEIKDNISRSHRDKDTPAYMLSDITKDCDFSVNSTATCKTRKHKNMQDDSSEDSDNTIICENLGENDVGIGRQSMAKFTLSERKIKKTIKIGTIRGNNVKRITGKKVRKLTMDTKDLQTKTIANNQKNCKSNDEFLDDKSFETGNEEFKTQGSSRRRTKSAYRKKKKEIGTDDDCLLGETTAANSSKGEKDGSESQEDSATGENTKQEKKKEIRTGHLFPCEICGSLMLHEYLTRHLQTHEEKTISCDQCDTKFACKSNLKTHMRQVHTDEKKYVCDTCGKSFKAWPYLKQHRLTHNKEKNEKCPECPARFRYVGLLRVHMKSHSDEKPFSCDVCGMKFRRGYPLKLHKMSHSDERKFSCPECQKMFKKKTDMKKHFRIHLPPQYFCEVCGKSFVDRTNMRTHMKVHGKFK